MSVAENEIDLSSDVPGFIRVGADESRLFREVLFNLARDEELFHREGKLVHVVTEEGKTRIIELSEAVIRERISSKVAGFYRVKKSDKEHGIKTTVPQTVVKYIATRKHYADYFRPLRGVATSMFLRPDGTLVKTPGYDQDTGVLMIPIGRQPSIHHEPTRDDAIQAAKVLLDVIHDFPVENPEDKSAWLALVLTMAGRTAFEGPAPLFLFDSNVRGAGKGLMADVAAIIATGQPVPVSAIADDADEIRKGVTTSLIYGDPVVLFDNLDSAFGGKVIDALLTSSVWRDRVLGSNDRVELPVLTTFVATGNNVELKGDTSRRTLQCRLLSDRERPEERDDFERPDLRRYVRENRAELYGAALTILRAWFVSGKPAHSLPTWGSFEGWSGVIREAIAFANRPDPAKTRERLMLASDTDASAMVEVLATWPKFLAEKARTTAEVIRAADGAGENSEFRDAVVALIGVDLDDKGAARRLGQRLGKFRDRRLNGMRLSATKTSGQFRWRPKPDDPKPKSETADPVPF